ncbi:lytic transglycosylase domain-containing protein [Simiduia aestuariiviva]|uniref:Soluble lytic murein transglycosylase-like protein n=1 Tax=Simiduia aestuariiviva TaxID=1510459 RepID=A0A839UQX9_9GAMM|nr:lytic transglycosylase domain-containing protein [Simiduia aestuariiviva]MBB3167817.1 soluble lytic murein transglycosylase-like protein [Simiduia aestuariiviva]
MAKAYIATWLLALVLLPGLALGQSKPSDVDDELRQLLLNAVQAADSFTDRFDAEAWLMLQSSRLQRFVDEPEKRLKILRAVHSEATRAGLQPEIVLAVIEVESAFDRFAVSRVGAQGMMQIMPFWKHEIGRPEDNLIDMQTNLRYGCTILKHYLKRSDGHWADALARYNGSYGRYWYPERVMNAWERWR